MDYLLSNWRSVYEAGCSGLVIISREDGTSAAGCSPQPVSGGAMFAGPGACSSMQPLPSGEQERAECESDNGSPAETGRDLIISG